GHLVAGIGEEGEVEAVLVAELAVARDRVGRDAEDQGAPRLDLAPAVAEGAGLFRTAGRVVLRIEIEDDRLAAQLRQLNLPAVVGGQAKVGRARALGNPIGHRRRLLFGPGRFRARQNCTFWMKKADTSSLFVASSAA